MKYIKLFENNNNVENNCTFEMFKEIMYDISDEHETDFEEEDDYYSCVIFLKEVLYFNNDNNNITVDYLNIEDLNSIEFIDTMNDEINDIYKALERLENILEESKKSLKIVKYFRKYIEPRFNQYTNFLKISIWIKSNALMIIFDKKLNI
jgi:hypothetical protein